MKEECERENKRSKISAIVPHEDHVLPEGKIPAVGFKDPERSNPHRHQQRSRCDEGHKECR